jgi:mannan endo-1,4-beta-mannosidase
MKSITSTSTTLLEVFAKTADSPKVFSGQNIGSANYHLIQNYKASILELQQKTWKTPAIFSIDYAWEKALDDYDEANVLLKNHLNDGGVVMVSMHPGNPFLGEGLYTKGTGDFVFDDLFKAGTEPYIHWQNTLKKIADGLENLQQTHTILWRPLHEMNGAWFWWGGGNSEQITQTEFKKLWMSIYDYFKMRKLNNLLWVYSPNSHHDKHSTVDVLDLYPGDSYVDIVALDYYADTFSFLNKNGSIDKLLSLHKPFGFAELGQQGRKKIANTDVLDVIQKKFPQTAFVIHWHTDTDKFWPVPRSIVDNSYADEYLNDSRVITLDDLK